MRLHTTLAVAALTAALLPSTVSAQQQTTEPGLPILFEAVAPGAVTRMSDEPAAVRQRNVTVRTELLATMDKLGQKAADMIILNLFDDVTVTANFLKTANAYGGGYVSHYTVEGDVSEDAIFSVMGEAMTATIWAGDTLYKVNHVGNGEHTVSKVDPMLYPSCGTPNPPEDVEGEVDAGGRAQETWADRTMDVMVVYTDDARAAQGGTNGIVSLINLADYETNLGYARSDVDVRHNLVHTEEVTYNETGNEVTFRDHLQNPSDGVLDYVATTLRDHYGADIVNGIYASGGYCGVAYQVICNLNASNEAGGFCVTSDGCATGNYSYGHEIGHLQGAQHDRANTGGCGLTTYCYGWRTSDNAYRSIMSYAPGSRQNMWSNDQKDAPNGLALGASGTDENWATLNYSATHISGYRAERRYGNGVKTLMDGGNGHAGNMFDIQPKSDLNFYALYVNSNTPSGNTVNLNVWYRYGTYVGHESSSTNWILLASPSATSAGPDASTLAYITNSHTFEAGETYGFYIEQTNYASGTDYLRYTNGTNTYEDQHLKLSLGVGKTPNFGTTFSSRTWNGTVFYRESNGHKSLSTTFAGGNGFAGNMFNVTATNPIVINGLKCNIDASGNPGIVTVDVWTRNGSYVGHEDDPYDWTYLGSDFKSTSSISYDIAIPGVNMNAGQTKAFYVHLGSYEAGHSLTYTTGSNNYSNADLSISAGAGKDNQAFTGTTYAGRTWNGTIYYSLQPFINLGNAHPGTYGNPVLTGSASGPLLPGVNWSLNLTNARKSAICALIVGFSRIDVPFKGGTLVPAADVLYILSTNGSGNLPINTTWAPGLSPGFSAYFQYWIQDPAGVPGNHSGSNALQVTTP